jgi:Cys-rich protein (TIGR01571 family)
MAAPVKRSLILLSFLELAFAERMWAFSRDALEVNVSEHVQRHESKATKPSVLQTTLKSQLFALRYIDSSAMIESIASVFQGGVPPERTGLTGDGSTHDKSAAGKSSSIASEVEAELESEVKKVESIETAYVMPQVNPLSQFTRDAMYYRFINAIFWLAVAIIYRLTKTPPKQDENPDTFDFSHWSSDSFDCCQDPAICCMATCCQGIRWSQTADMAGILKYWIAIAFLFVMSVLLPLDIYVAMFAGLIIGGRSRLRQIYSMKGQGECGTICGDVILICFCPCISIAQEARHVEAAKKAGILGEPVEINPPERASVEEKPSAPPQDVAQEKAAAPVS